MNIDKETALDIHDAIMSKVVRAVALAEMNAADGLGVEGENDENIDDIRDYLCRAIGLTADDVEKHASLNP